jgi:hypothetical protein
MKAYVITSGAVFGLLTIAHIVRAIFEGVHVVANPIFVIITLISAGLCIWAVTTLRRLT